MTPNRYLSSTLQDTATSERLPSEPSKRRRLWRAVTGLSILIVVLAVFASQQWGDGDDSGGPLNAIAAAAERTQREPGGRATMRAVVSSPTRSEPLTITGEMVFNDETGRARAVMRFPHSESDGSTEMEVVGDGTVVYMRSSLFGSLPGGHEWMALDFSFGHELDIPLPANGDAKGELELLEETTGVRKLGKEDVRGVPTTRYSGTVGVSEQAERLREKGAEDLASYIEEEGTPLRLEVWIGADGLVRRMRFVKSEPGEGGEGSTTVDMRMDFFDFGIVPEINVPESSEVFDATALAQNELGL